MSWRELMGVQAHNLQPWSKNSKIAEIPNIPLPTSYYCDFANFAPNEPVRIAERQSSDRPTAADDWQDDPEELDRLAAMGSDVWADNWEALYARTYGQLPPYGPLAAGRLSRVSSQALAKMETPHLTARADAAAVRLARLESAGLDDRLPEVKGLRAELRWVARHRPESIAPHGTSVEMTIAPSGMPTAAGEAGIREEAGGLE